MIGMISITSNAKAHGKIHVAAGLLDSDCPMVLCVIGMVAISFKGGTQSKLGLLEQLLASLLLHI